MPHCILPTAYFSLGTTHSVLPRQKDPSVTGFTVCTCCCVDLGPPAAFYPSIASTFTKPLTMLLILYDQEK